MSTVKLTGKIRDDIVTKKIEIGEDDIISKFSNGEYFIYKDGAMFTISEKYFNNDVTQTIKLSDVIVAVEYGGLLYNPTKKFFDGIDRIEFVANKMVAVLKHPNSNITDEFRVFFEPHRFNNKPNFRKARQLSEIRDVDHKKFDSFMARTSVKRDFEMSEILFKTDTSDDDEALY